VGQGLKIKQVAKLLGVNWEMARAALHHARGGGRPHAKGSGWRAESLRRDRTSVAIRIAEEVRRLRDEEGLSFDAIARRVHASPVTVVQAYDRAHPELAGQAGSRRGRASRLGAGRHGEIVRRLRSGEIPAEIARAVGCSKPSVYRIRESARLAPADRRRAPVQARIAEEVRRLRDEEGLSFAAIGRRVGSTAATAARAYDRVHPELAGKTGRRRGNALRLGVERHREILRRLGSGEAAPEVAVAVGCSKQAVCRIGKAERLERRAGRDGEILRRLGSGEAMAEVALAVGCSTATVQRVRKAERLGRPDGRGERHREILRRLGSGEAAPEVAVAVGCSRATVNRVRRTARLGRPDGREEG
jgi:DNA-binding CsgD family transcriptional regulator